MSDYFDYDFTFLLNNSKLFLNTYLLKKYDKNINNVDLKLYLGLENGNLLFDSLYSDTKFLFKSIDYYINNDFVESIIIEVTNINDDKVQTFSIDKNSKNVELPNGTKILLFEKHIRNFILYNGTYYPPILTFKNINISKIEDDINLYLENWEKNNFRVNNKNFFKKEKQIDLVTNFLKKELNSYNNYNLLLSLSSLYHTSSNGVTTLGGNMVMNYPIDILAVLLFLEKNSIIKIKEIIPGNTYFDEMKILVDIDEEKINGNLNIENKIEENYRFISIINSFLEKINNLKIYEKEGCLKTRLEQDLITELRNYNYKNIIFNDITLLKIEKILSHPQTIWADRRGFSNSVSPYILEWEKLFKGIIGNKEEEILDDMNIKDNNIIESTIEQKQLTQILREKVIVFSFEKDNQHLYIKHNNNLKTLIKTVIFDSDYEIVANEMYNSETGIIEITKIKEKYKRNINSLADIKKYLGFNNVLLKLFFDGANKNKIIFFKNITTKRLKDKNITESDVLLYLEKKFG